MLGWRSSWAIQMVCIEVNRLCGFATILHFFIVGKFSLVNYSQLSSPNICLRNWHRESSFMWRVILNTHVLLFVQKLSSIKNHFSLLFSVCNDHVRYNLC